MPRELRLKDRHAAVTQQTAGLETDKVDVGDTNFKYFGYAPLRYTPSDANLSHEHVVHGDETGVQGRFESNVGRIVSAVFKAMNVPITLGDYKASQRAKGEGKEHMQHILGQIAEYLYLAKFKFGYISTYDETIFLKQELTQDGWVLFHSSIILHSKESEGEPSLRECLWYIALAAEGKTIF
ncbi:hypothetical protein C8Q69DRAFT_444433 [Paecilomyces variotii]|uniref:Uncharacterized protein n=1 Tax=Byssochlamys spectabilis TaxID=264951 RepID=A0A443HUN1_BYSSP|nr:hypothetical protein C8Q69DRAFT_444433 [Paecilomyces variotii]RWQ95527.1 hypothetical protein C8Q69DRAFT_444433 [Paecilomyces variotii]